MQMNIIKTAHKKVIMQLNEQKRIFRMDFTLLKSNKKSRVYSKLCSLHFSQPKMWYIRRKFITSNREERNSSVHLLYWWFRARTQITNIYLLSSTPSKKFIWLYPTKSTDAAEMIQKLEIQKAIFGSTSRIFSDKGSASTSKTFDNYYTRVNVQHFQIATNLPSANCQV